MRLIDTETGEFVEFVDMSKIPPYAILSHTWEPPPIGEQSYQDVMKIQEKYRQYGSPPGGEALSTGTWRSDQVGIPQSTSSISRERLRSYSIFLGLQPLWCILIFSLLRTWLSLLLGPSTSYIRRAIWDHDSGLSKKVRRACQIARLDGYRYIWIDSCCIDKASSSELSEAINSMYNWYRGAQVCYAFLADVPFGEDVRTEGSRFRRSRWFTRGWTLQELIAPFVVVFLSQDWEGLGTKDALADVISEITFIDRGILTHEKALSDESVAERMRWASMRTTTRVEDEAYSLLGIFGITMPTLYGEGEYAFRRLQEEIMQRIPDQSLFAWGSLCLPIPQEPLEIGVWFTDSTTPFAPSPHSFASSRGRTIRATGYSVKSLGLPVEEYTHTPYGIRTQLCLLPLQALNPELRTNDFGSATVRWYLIVLSSQHADDPRRLLSRLCYLRCDKLDVEFLHVPDWIALPEPQGGELDRRNALIFTLSLDDLARVRKTQLQIKTVYLPHPKPSVAERTLQGGNSPIHLTLPEWNRAALQTHGYTISDIRRHAAEKGHFNYASLTLSHPSIHIHIAYRQMLIHCTWFGDRDAVVIEARIWLLSPGPDVLTESDAAQAVQSRPFTGPPYTSATWADEEPWAMTLPARSVKLLTDSGDRVMLRLGLDLTAPSRYNVRVEVAPADLAMVGVSPPSRPDLNGLPKVLDDPHETFRLVLPGSVRMALEMKGYSAHLERSPDVGTGSHSHSLILSGGADSPFVIVVQFFHMLKNGYPLQDSQTLVVVARVTLESESGSASVPQYGSAETYQDGPYVAIWSDAVHTWKWSWEEKHIVLTTPTGEPLTLHLGFDFAWQSEYYLHIDIEPGTSRFRLQGPHEEYPYTLDGIHRNIVLTLPGHVRRALQREGYQVRFEGLDLNDRREGDPARYRLTLFNVDAGFDIVIDYSHNLTTDSGEPDYVPSIDSEPDSTLLTDSDSESLGLPRDIHRKATRRPRQELTFQACVKVLPSRRGFQGDTSQGVVAQGEGATIDWNARHPRVGVWRRHFPRKDVTLVLSTWRRLTLRLGFYLVWYSEFCLVVEINPGTPLSHTNSEQDDAGIEYICRSLSEYTEPGQSAEAHDEPLPTGPSTTVAPEGSPVTSQESAGDESVGGDEPDFEPMPSGSGA